MLGSEPTNSFTLTFNSVPVQQGFYFVRSTPRTIKIFQRTHFMISTKRQRMPRWDSLHALERTCSRTWQELSECMACGRWQASDQWAINHAIDDHVVEWEPGSRQRMAGIESFSSKFYDNSSHVCQLK